MGGIKTEVAAREAVCRDGEALKYVPEELRTPELCMEAVRQSDGALESVPDALLFLKIF